MTYMDRTPEPPKPYTRNFH